VTRSFIFRILNAYSWSWKREALCRKEHSHVRARISFLVPRWSTWRVQGPFLPLNKIVFKIPSSKFRSENMLQPCFPNWPLPTAKAVPLQSSIKYSITVNYRQLHQSDRSDRSASSFTSRRSSDSLQIVLFQNVHKVRHDLRMRHRSISINR